MKVNYLLIWNLIHVVSFVSKNFIYGNTSVEFFNSEKRNNKFSTSRDNILEEFYPAFG